MKLTQDVEGTMLESAQNSGRQATMVVECAYDAVGEAGVLSDEYAFKELDNGDIRAWGTMDDGRPYDILLIQR